MHRFGEQAWGRSMCLYLSDEGQSLRNTDLSCVRAHVSVHTLVHLRHLREHHAPSIPCEILFANELAVRGVNGGSIPTPPPPLPPPSAPAPSNLPPS